MIWQALGALVDVFHALTILLWVGGMPLLFSRRTPRLRHAYATYAVVFIALYQLSRWLLDECFLTTLARHFWRRAPRDLAGGGSDEWFTVRVANAIFHLAPSHRLITVIAQILILVTAAGVLAPRIRRRLLGKVPA